MKKGYKKYTLDHWDTQHKPIEGRTLPDNLVDAVMRVSQNFKNLTDQDITAPFYAKFVKEFQIPIEDSLALARSFLTSFHPAFADEFEKAEQDGRAHLEPVSKKNKHGEGWYDDKKINYIYDETVNDSIYLVHETGHMLAGVLGPSEPNSNIEEWQSYFLQLAFFDHMQHKSDVDLPFNETLLYHRNLEILMELALLKLGIDAHAQLKTHQARKDKNSLNGFIYTMKEHLFMKKFIGLQDDAYSVHSYPTAMPIAAALYRTYKDADERTQEHMRQALYCQGDQATPESILEAFGLSDISTLEKEIEVALEEAGLERWHITDPLGTPNQNYAPE